MKSRVNIGTASIVLIFIILCLSVFSLLSLSDGKSALVFAERHAASVTAYYETDAMAQKLIAHVVSAAEDGTPAEEAMAEGLKELPEGSFFETAESGNLICGIPMTAGQALHVELKKDSLAVLSYYVYNQEDYAIDNSLPVWVNEQ